MTRSFQTFVIVLNLLFFMGIYINLPSGSVYTAPSRIILGILAVLNGRMLLRLVL